MNNYAVMSVLIPSLTSGGLYSYGFQYASSETELLLADLLPTDAYQSISLILLLLAAILCHASQGVINVAPVLEELEDSVLPEAVSVSNFILITSCFAQMFVSYENQRQSFRQLCLYLKCLSYYSIYRLRSLGCCIMEKIFCLPRIKLPLHELRKLSEDEKRNLIIPGQRTKGFMIEKRSISRFCKKAWNKLFD